MFRLSRDDAPSGGKEGLMGARQPTGRNARSLAG
jgi:hypothetical protein